MRALLFSAVMVIGLVMGSSCVDAPPQPTEVAISVAALDLPSVSNAVYTIEVQNLSGETVFSQQVDSVGYGAGNGSASYVGPCDADDNDNKVLLTLDQLWANGTQLTGDEYKNPGTLERTFTCVANQDIAVDFDLTIIRPANQGFFDIAVTFDNIFCSAKLDCKGQDDQPIMLLHDADGARSTTLVMGFACTTGRDGDVTTLYRDDVDVTCGGATVTVNPDGVGNLPAGNITGTSGILFGAQVTRGQEQFSFDKQYWNVALGLTDTAGVYPADCYLDSAASAARGFFEFRTTRDGTSYPYIVWNHIQLTDGSGDLICSRHGVDSTPAGVETAYVPLDTPYTFDHLWSTHDIPIQGQGVAGAPRYWADGTVAESCLDYFTPPTGYAYTGAVGDGIYKIDPDGDGPAAAMEVTCDMESTTTGGGWTLVASEDFEGGGNTVGWSWSVNISSCGIYGNIMWDDVAFAPNDNGYTEKTYNWTAPIAHTQARLNLDFIKIDSWDTNPPSTDAGYIDFTRTEDAPTGGVFQKLTFASTDGTQQCGAPDAGWNETSAPVELVIAHDSIDTANAARVRASSTLDSPGGDESWGLDNVAIWVK